MLAGMWQWQTTEFEAGRPLLEALALRVPAAPQAFLRQLIRKGRILCGDQPATAEMSLSCGLRLHVQTSARFNELAAAGGVEPQAILFEDRQALVVYKPAGLAVHRAANNHDNLVERVARLGALRRAPYRLAPVHRLDIGTSGPVLFAKGRQAAGEYGRLLMNGRIGKHYLALVAGRIAGTGVLTTAVPAGRSLKPALARYRALATGGTCSLLELDLVTGRQHQARRQLADAGWPILGDRRYGGPPWPGLDHPFLHGHSLRFPSLDDGGERQVDCPLPPLLAGILAATGLSVAAAAVPLREKCPPGDDEQV